MGQTRFSGPVLSDAGFILANELTNGVGQLSWNGDEGTANLTMPGGITQQIGLEQFMRVDNITGSTIPNGTVVAFAGVNGDIKVAPFNANGSVPTLYVVGIVTEDILDNAAGFCTTFGKVHELDTTGTPVGEVWVKGDLLYANPTYPGKMTKVKPTAPNAVIVLAAVLAVSATDGIIFVRPAIEMQKYYGSFSDTATKTAAAAYTPQAITLNTTDFAYGFSRGTPTSRIVAFASGLYNFQFSAQVSSGSASAKKMWIWPRINGIDVPNSNSEVTVSGSGTVLIPAWNWVLSLNANDYFEMMFAVDDTNVQIVAVAAATGANGTAGFARPAVPSIILTVTQVQQ